MGGRPDDLQMGKVYGTIPSNQLGDPWAGRVGSDGIDRRFLGESPSGGKGYPATKTIYPKGCISSPKDNYYGNHYHHELNRVADLLYATSTPNRSRWLRPTPLSVRPASLTIAANVSGNTALQGGTHKYSRSPADVMKMYQIQALLAAGSITLSVAGTTPRNRRIWIRWLRSDRPAAGTVAVRSVLSSVPLPTRRRDAARGWSLPFKMRVIDAWLVVTTSAASSVSSSGPALVVPVRSFRIDLRRCRRSLQRSADDRFRFWPLRPRPPRKVCSSATRAALR
jgi:hypothetical protein